MKPELQSVFAGKKVAFISVFDKQGLEPLARTLSEQYGYVILSTGGTKKFLDDKKIPAIESSEITGFGELLGGRVKSLHPEIFAGILAESKDREDKDSVPFSVDVVVVNLYPFETERDRFAAEEDSQDPFHMLHFVDIGGSALIRAAAKNYPVVNILGSPAQYEAFLQELERGKGETAIGFRKKLAVEAFAQSSYYDGLVNRYLMGQLQQQNEAVALPDAMTLPLSKITDLRYGENPHQQAALYGLAKRGVDFEYLHGKELSFNNILDMQAAWNIATEFTENAACVIVKHNNPCGVAMSTQSVEDAFQRALDTDPLSAFGGVVAFNQPVNEETAKRMKDIFLEVIIAPDFEPEAFDILSTKKNLRLVKRELPELKVGQTDYKQVADDLFLVQTVDEKKMGQSNQLFKVATDKKPSDAQLEDMVFAWKIVKHVKSNAIVLAKNGKTVGIGGGQTSRIGALENALKLACDEAKDAVLASDGFLPHEDNIYAAAHARVGAIIQPGGSVKDPDVIKLANQYNIAMITTGVREFRH
jgi:phosphoribosylaminoimidazolecarboxamide formyltransferase/IMP cyclohydrolase